MSQLPGPNFATKVLVLPFSKYKSVKLNFKLHQVQRDNPKIFQLSIKGLNKILDRMGLAFNSSTQLNTKSTNTLP